MVFVVGACDDVGVQVKTAVVGEAPFVILAPAGGFARLQMSELAVMPAVLVTEAMIVTVVPGMMLVSLIGLSTRGPTAWP